MQRTADGAQLPDSLRGKVTEGIRSYLRYIPDGTGISDDRWNARHRNILVALALHIPFLLALGLYEGTDSAVTGATIPAIPTWMVLGMLGVVVALLGLASWPRLGRRSRTALASVGLMTTSTILVRFSGGYIEAHFHFFVVMAIIAVYEDWLPFGLGLGYVAGGHVVFSLIDPSTVYNHSAAINFPWAWSGIHAVGIIMLCSALMTNWISIEKSREESAARLQQVADQKSEIANVEEAMAEAEARREEVEELNAHLESKADDYSTRMDRAADGELTVRVDTDSRSDAMVQIGGSVNDLLDEIESAMEEIKAFSAQVADSTQETTTSVEGAQTASRSVNRSVGHISENADEQRTMLEEVSGEMSNLSATIEEVASSAQGVADTSERTAEIADTGEMTAQEARARMEEVENAIESTVANVQSLEDQMVDIGEIVDLISDIADQTNLLALNANIEAARAGAGTGGAADGFAVVADEVKALAEETQDAAGDIEELIQETQAQTERTVTDVREAETDIEAGVAAVDEVTDSLSEVASNTENTNQGIQEISRATDDQAASTEETVAMIEPVTEISRQTASEAADVSETAEAQAETMNAVSSNADSLTRQADRLQDLLATFSVSGSATGHPSGRSSPTGRVAMNDGGQQE